MVLFNIILYHQPCRCKNWLYCYFFYISPKMPSMMTVLVLCFYKVLILSLFLQLFYHIGAILNRENILGILEQKRLCFNNTGILMHLIFGRKCLGIP